MTRQMPILAHKGQKFIAGQSFWSIPQDIIVYAFKHLTYNETQVLIYLIGNKPKSEDEDFKGWQISNIEDCISGNDRTIRAARATLAQMGFIKQIPNQDGRTYSTIVVDFDWIRTAIRNDWDKDEVIQNFAVLQNRHLVGNHGCTEP